MNGSFLISQVRSCMRPHASKIAEEAFFRLSYLEYNFMIASLVRLNLAILRISKTFQEHTGGGVLCQ